MSLGELIRESLEAALGRGLQGDRAEQDAFWSDDVVHDGPVPADLSTEHDRHLYGSS